MYFLAKKFFRQEIAMVGACFFLFSPYMIENSLLGITDSLFIFLIVSFLSLFFSDKKTSIIGSFFVLGISSLVRYESLLLIIPTTIIFLAKYRSNISFRKFYWIGLALFFLAIIPMALWKIQMGMDDGLASSLIDGASHVINENSINSETIDRFDLVRGIIDLPKYIGASLLPICFIFVPYSVISLLRKENKNFRYLVLMGVFALIPALYACSRGFEEIRYVFVALPILIIASLFLIEKIILRFGKQNVVAGGLIALIIVSSIIYLDFREPDYDYENEVIEVAKFVSGLSGRINDYGHESYYVEVMDLEDKKFPILSSEINLQSKVITLQGETINEVIQDARNKELSYLAVTDNQQILSKIYHQEYNYSYLKKIFDSNEHHIKFKIKIFEINFNELDISR
jgi:4-amino-4-deoxy-L-arabinose transferase-like glycosyltransferase